MILQCTNAIKNENVRNLPVISTCDDEFVLQVKLDIVDGSPAPFRDIGMSKHGLHALELAMIVI